MKLEYFLDTKELVATDDIISDFASNPTQYDTVEMTTTLTCGTAVTQEYDVADIENSNNKFYLINEEIVIELIMFNLTDFIDGIYRVDIKFRTANGFTRIYNCIFIDITIKCQLASLLSKLLDGDVNSETAHLLHYSLVNGSNCGCECDAMCANYNALQTILNNQPVTNTDCGC